MKITLLLTEKEAAYLKGRLLKPPGKPQEEPLEEMAIRRRLWEELVIQLPAHA